MINPKYFKVFLVVLIFFIFEFLVLRDTPFFWDSVSKSLRARWLYDSNFQQFVVPTEINSGHPPLWILILSFWWKIFGATLFSSRFLLLIINILIGYQLILLFKNIAIPKVPIIAVIIVFLEPTYMAQTTIMNNDMLLLLFTLIAFNCVIKFSKTNSILFTIALTGILFSNLRGMLIFSCIFMIDILIIKFKLLESGKKIKFSPYFISASLLGVFLIYQYNILGWVIKTPSPNWSDQRENASLLHILKNIASIIRNFLDYGRVFLFLVAIIFLYRQFKSSKINIDKNTKILLVSIVVFSIGLSLFFIFFTNPIGHRYFMISYILIVLTIINLLYLNMDKQKIKKYLLIIILAFVTGHFWIYPSTIAQGWDSSLAYLNYFELRDDMEMYISEQDISKNIIGTNLPLNSKKYSDLIPNNLIQEKYAELNLEENSYIILSNIENKTSDEDINSLFENWVVVKNYNSIGVYIILFKNPNN